MVWTKHLLETEKPLEAEAGAGANKKANICIDAKTAAGSGGSVPSNQKLAADQVYLSTLMFLT